MNVFDWDIVRPKFEKQSTRDAFIRAAFKQYVEGNSCYEDMDGQEAANLFDMFRASWIICENLLDNPTLS